MLTHCSGWDRAKCLRHVHGLHIDAVLAVIPSPRNLLGSREWVFVLSRPFDNIYLFCEEKNGGHWDLRVR